MGRKLTGEEQSRRKYIAWMRLTHNGRRSREEMSPAEQIEYDSYDFKSRSAWDDETTDHEAVKRLYDEATGRA